jgi:hypothetical protein
MMGPRTRGIDLGAWARELGLGLLALASLGVQPAVAHEAESDTTAPVPCAIISAVAGQVDVLDSSRTHLLDSAEKASIPCGSWVSVGKGSVELKHRDGFKLNAGAGTFLQLPEPNTDGKYSGDQAILFRGQVFAQAGGGSGQLRVLTANARARVQRGSAIVVYSQEDEETQIVALDHSSTLENRFQVSRKVEAKAGEATSLNFKQLRVVPSTPRAVALAALRPKFDDLRVPERDRKTALRTAQARQERLFASELVKDDPVQDGAKADRKPSSASPSAPHGGYQPKGEDPSQDVRAHLEQAKKKVKHLPSAQSYSSRPSDEQVEAIRRSWTNRLVAGEAGAEKFLSPRPAAKAGARHGGAGSARAQARGGSKARRLTAEDEEKLRLIEELSRLREE